MTVTKARHLLVTEAGIDLNSFNFGSPHTRTTFNSYILQLPNGDYSIYRPWQWNHLCFAWSEGGKSKMVLVRQNGAKSEPGSPYVTWFTFKRFLAGN